MAYTLLKTSAGLAGVLLCLLLAACATESSSPTKMNPPLPENPLPSCPGSPNCIRQTRLFGLPPDTLFARAQTALHALGASTLSVIPETRRIDAVFTVFLFKDDLALAVEPHEEGAALHIRSASRKGHSDFGVNRRRVERFFAELEKLL